MSGILQLLRDAGLSGDQYLQHQQSVIRPILLTMQVDKQFPDSIAFVAFLVQAFSSLAVGLFHRQVLVMTPETEGFSATSIISIPRSCRTL